MPRVIVCDVNGTLLDIGALEPAFRKAFGDRYFLDAARQIIAAELADRPGEG